jgi:TPP-dependent pyruvate/acetoin dehydrogenase alpha subunit
MTNMEQKDYQRLYHSLLLIRRLEEKIAAIYHTDKIKSPIHLSIGQEFVSVGVCDVLRKDDVVFGSCRGHAMYLAKGGNLKRMVAELYGKSTGCARGRGGSMHLVDTESGVMGTPAIVASAIPHAVGYAMAQKYKKTDRVAVCFLGDGAAEEGVFHESINFARLKQLPVLFVCENNSYAIHSHIEARTSQTRISDRVQSYGVPAVHIDSGDMLAIRDTTQQMVTELRSGAKGPHFLECMTYRWMEHVGPKEDWHMGYRSEQDAAFWKENDQVERFAELLPKQVRDAVEQTVSKEMQEAFEFAEQSQFPGPEELYDHLYNS